MKTIKHKELALLLVGSLVASAPVFASNGSDDGLGSSTSGSSGTSGTSGTAGTSGTSGTSGTAGTSGTSGTSGTAGTSGTSGTASTSCNAAGSSNQCDFVPSFDTSVVKGSHKKVYKRNGNKQDVIIKIKIGKNGGLVTPENFNDDIGVVRAIFPGGQVCELEGVGKTRKFYN